MGHPCTIFINWSILCIMCIIWLSQIIWQVIQLSILYRRHHVINLISHFFRHFYPPRDLSIHDFSILLLIFFLCCTIRMESWNGFIFTRWCPPIYFKVICHQRIPYIDRDCLIFIMPLPPSPSSSRDSLKDIYPTDLWRNKPIS